MALTQSQLDEAMKPVSLLSCVSVENGANRISEPNLKSASVVPKNNTFPSGKTPIKSLLAEGKIQFGELMGYTPQLSLWSGSSSYFKMIYFFLLYQVLLHLPLLLLPVVGVRRRIALYILKKTINIQIHHPLAWRFVKQKQKLL